MYAPGRIRWSTDNWVTAHDTELAGAGLGVYVHVHEFEKSHFTHAIAIEFTFYWNSVKRWERQDFSMAVIKKMPGPQYPLQKFGVERESGQTEVFEPSLQ